MGHLKTISLFNFILADIGKYFTKMPRSIVVPPGDHVTFECETNIPAEQVCQCYKILMFQFLYRTNT